MEYILNHFPKFTPKQIEQFNHLYPFYTDWNQKVNLISRKDIENLYPHHVLHSLSLLKVCFFKPNTTVLDIGTGGGFPGIPLAIACPEVQFHLIDARNKKIKVVNQLIQELGLKNVAAEHIRVEDLKDEQYNFAVSRAVTNLALLTQWSKKLIVPSDKDRYNKLANGLLILKGGNLKKEIKELGKKAKVFPVKKYFPFPYYEEKFIVHIQA